MGTIRKIITFIWMWLWGAVYGLRKLFSGRLWRKTTAAAAAPDLTSEHAVMLAAARGGDVLAQYQLAVCYSEGRGVEQDYGEAAHWFREAANHGDVNASYSLGVCYANGQGVAEDLASAVKCFRAAAESALVLVPPGRAPRRLGRRAPPTGPRRACRRRSVRPLTQRRSARTCARSRGA